jgi:hypothetical protein
MRRWRMENLEGWIAKVEVVKTTGLTERTLERMVKRGELRRDYRNQGENPFPSFTPRTLNGSRRKP